MEDFTKKQLERMVFSKKYYRRAEAARHGVGLEVLVNDEHPLVRAAVAEQGYGLEKLVRDDEWIVKMAVAEQGFELERYVNDLSGLVRKVVAQHGYRLDLLLNDPFPDVRAAAREYVFERLPVNYRALVYVPLAELGFSQRIVNRLLPGSPGGLRTLGDLMMVPAEDLKRFSELGEKSHKDIEERFVAFFEGLKDSPWAYGAFESLEDIFDALKVEVEKVVGASVDDSKWFGRVICNDLIEEKNSSVLALIENAAKRCERIDSSGKSLDGYVKD